MVEDDILARLGLISNGSHQEPEEDINLNIQFVIELNNEEDYDDGDGEDDRGRLVTYDLGIVHHDDGHDYYYWDHHSGGDEDDYYNNDDDDDDDYYNNDDED